MASADLVDKENAELYSDKKIKHMGVFFHEFRKILQSMFVWDGCRNVQKFMIIRQCSSSKVFSIFFFPSTLLRSPQHLRNLAFRTLLCPTGQG